ncbi:MAG: RdgB/HAM1 family non-canonical purine NTP pyrophosphatase [Treponemataceae bacterium]|nr:MAG: RdgB/HAM1 family non-canonical purine NTP pyrophosphatase [Treponemataceae bacterium]
MDLFLASNNRHKQKEFSDLFPEHCVIIPANMGIAFDPDETGTSFAENCLIKARALFDILAAQNIRAPVLADDSGLCVDILGGRPGIRSSRYTGNAESEGAGYMLSQAEKNRLLVEEVNAALLPPSLSLKNPRSCRFVCALVLYAAPDRFFLAQETMEGEIVKRVDLAHGAGGFGYDPIVRLQEFGKTAAELLPAEKNAVSHRGKAARALEKMIIHAELSAKDRE